MIGNLLAIVALILLSACFSGTEIAYASSSELRLRNAAAGGSRLKVWAHWIYQRYDSAITALLLGNNVVNMAASSLATVVVIGLLGSGYAWVATVAMTILLLIFGEIVPKVLARERPEQIAALAAAPLRGLMWLLRPVIALVQAFVRLVSHLWQRQAEEGPSVTEDDIEVILDTAEDEGAIDENTTELLQSALDFDDMLVYEIITPRVDMVAVDIEDSMEAIKQAALSSPFTRLPVYEESKDNIIGVLHLNRFMKRLSKGDMSHEALRAMLMPVCFVPKTTKLPSVLGIMRQSKHHLVVVDDEYGGTLGIITMEDVLEELVGDIWDETDQIRTEFKALPDGRFEASGDMRVEDFLEALDVDSRDFDGESVTVGGWAIEQLGDYPREGESFVYDGLDITVSRVHKRRVRQVVVTHAAVQTPEST